MRIAFLAFLLLLTACAEYQARQKAIADEQIIKIETSKRQYCKDMGAKPGTHAYVECREQIARVEMQRQMQAQAFYNMQANAAGNSALMGIANDTYVAPGSFPPPTTRCVTRRDYLNNLITECR